ncbi:hypothetical protein KC19_9G077400 [Ceratodon purpureus]|uniref:Uncharacterized protein n=1 Tax=Ceratodon purpureus TaxID=3225 RepID=A0A8T0GTW8_CERPU|nr:hypothetical protein KC19_9G077400 [Ceratodon purpureus]
MNLTPTKYQSHSPVKSSVARLHTRCCFIPRSLHNVCRCDVNGTGRFRTKLHAGLVMHAALRQYLPPRDRAALISTTSLCLLGRLLFRLHHVLKARNTTTVSQYYQLRVKRPLNCTPQQ